MTTIKTFHEVIGEDDTGMVSATDRLKLRFEKDGFDPETAVFSAHNHNDVGLWVVVGTAVKE